MSSISVYDIYIIFIGDSIGLMLRSEALQSEPVDMEMRDSQKMTA
jgi:hypothetical protein